MFRVLSKNRINICFSGRRFSQYLSAICLIALLLAGSVFTAKASPSAIIYDNGTLASGATSKSGVAAPAGTQWSEDQNDFGVTNYANTLAGVGCQQITTSMPPVNNRCADDFNVPVGQTWTINSVIVFGYQTGFAGATSPFTSANLRIWSGRPGDAGSTIVFGDTTTNRLATSTDSMVFRIFNSVVGTGANPPSVPGTTRRIWQNTLTVSPALVLTAGNYWIDFQTNAGASGNFTPTNTIVGTRGAPFWNARQSVGGTTWADIVDVGQTPTGNPTPVSVPQDFPFKLDGTINVSNTPRSRSLEFNGDNRTDFVVARSATAVSQSTWWILRSSGATSATDFGLGVGFSAGDKPVPGDYDGDGLTDIAVWRPGAPTVASFFILNSSNSTVRVEAFGQVGDDSSVVGDYDGDGKTDLAVYRAGATPGAQSTFYYRGSLNNPSGNVTFVPWGLNGDIAVPGDFDGDGRWDFHVARNESGNLVHYELRTTAGVRIFQYGIAGDKLVTGDVDADNKTDIGAVRANGAVYDWYILKSGTGLTWFEKFGNPATDYIALGDYDGDNKTDIVVWRSGQSADQTNFFVRNTFASPQQVEWGQSAGAQTPPDYPIANYSVK